MHMERLCPLLYGTGMFAKFVADQCRPGLSAVYAEWVETSAFGECCVVLIRWVVPVNKFD